MALVAASAAASLALGAAPAEAGTLDQSQTSAASGGYNFSGTNWLAQTFTAGRSGQLDQVDVALAKFCNRNGVTVEIRAVTADGKPANTTLASTTIPDASVPSIPPFPPELLSVTFASPATVTAGTQYAIVLSAPTSTPCPSTTTQPYIWGYADGDPYPPGQAFNSSDGGMTWGATGTGTPEDFAFRTYVTEPSAPPPPPTAFCARKSATIVGSPVPDTIRGTAGRDVIAGLGGRDAIRGLAGNDIVCGGRGRDVLRGGGGNDKLLGGAGVDRLLGGPGPDTCNGGTGNDRARGCTRERRL